MFRQMRDKSSVGFSTCEAGKKEIKTPPGRVTLRLGGEREHDAAAAALSRVYTAS